MVFAKYAPEIIKLVADAISCRTQLPAIALKASVFWSQGHRAASGAEIASSLAAAGAKLMISGRNAIGLESTQ
jgi:hypothetical protein